MRSFVACFAAFTGALAALPSASVYTYSPTSQPPLAWVPSLSPSNARLYIAQQLGLSEYHGLGGADEGTLYALAHSASQQSLFAVPDQKSKAFLVLENVGDITGVLPNPSGRRSVALHLSDIPFTSSNVDLVEELLAIDIETRGTVGECDARKHPLAPFSWVSGGFYRPEMTAPCLFSKASIYDGRNSAKDEIEALSKYLVPESSVGSLKATRNAFHISLPEDTKQYKEAAASVHKLVQAILDSRKDLDLTILAVPSKIRTSPEATWDTKLNAPFGKRAVEEPSKFLDPRKNSSQPSTMLKVCGKSEDDCNSRTNQCSGHGTCVLKYTDTESDSKAECWACACSSTNETWGTAYWGGPACQKRDVSVQFWLFAGIGIFATAAVTWGIGLLYSIGESELPSVLGAGVAPTIRK